MRINNRQISFIKLLIMTEAYEPYCYYANLLHVSIKTLQRDLTIMNDFLKDYKGNIESKSSLGIKINITQDQKVELINELKIQEYLTTKLDQFTLGKEARRLDMLLMLLIYTDQPTSLSVLSDKYYISKSSIVKDLNMIEKTLIQFNLILERNTTGTIIVGSEKNIRDALIDTLSFVLDLNVSSTFRSLEYSSTYSFHPDTLNVILEMFQLEDITFVESQVNKIQEVFQITFAEQEYLLICLNLLILINRNKTEYYLEKETNQTFLEDKIIFQCAESISESIEKNYKIKLHQSETDSICKLLACTHIINDKNLSHIPEDDKSAMVSNYVDDFINDLESFSNINFSSFEGFKEGISQHIYPMMSRVFFGYQVKNPLIDDLKSMYYHGFMLTKAICWRLSSKFHLPLFCDDEIGFLLLYIQKVMEESKPSEKILLICNNPQSVSDLLITRLLNHYPNWDITCIPYIGEIDNSAADYYDLVLSTVIFNNANYQAPYVFISPLIGQKDFDNIDNVMNNIKEQRAGYRKVSINKLIELFSCTDFKIIRENSLNVNTKIDNTNALSVRVNPILTIYFILNRQSENQVIMNLNEESIEIIIQSFDMEYMKEPLKIVFLNWDNFVGCLAPKDSNKS